MDSSLTSLHPSPVFGPVHSRRLGVSLGINLMPGDGKLCSFDCVYCECGTNGERSPHTARPSREAVVRTLENVLRTRHAAGQPLHTLTFSGNGEPTLHPEFPGIIDDVLTLRNRWYPEAKVSVLSNATAIHRPQVREALMKVDNNIQKLDTVSDVYIHMIDRPAPSYRVEDTIRYLCCFEGHVIVQTIFMSGHLTLRWTGSDAEETFDADNTSETYLQPWLQALQRIRPQGVMVYTIDRPTPFPTLTKVLPETLDAIAARVSALGIPCSVSY